jgi:biotin carboxylase
MTRFSRYVRRSLVSPPASDIDRYGDWLVAAAADVDLVLPMDDGSMAAAVARAPELGAKVLIPGVDAWRTAREKDLSIRAARLAGLPVPAGAPAPDLGAARAIAAEVGYPVIVHARRESGGRGLAFVPDEGALPEAYERISRRDPAPLVMQQVPHGTMWSACLLYDREHRLRASFVQKQVRSFPVRGGASVLQESAHRPDLVFMADRLLSRLGWVGIAEVEFLQEPNGGPSWFMEVNPRFWASVAAAIQAGVDFPVLMAALAQNDNFDPPTYAAGQRCRWLLPGDILHFLTNPDRARMEPSFWRPGARDDTWSRDDPGPVFGFIVAALRQSLSPAAWRMLFRW